MYGRRAVGAAGLLKANQHKEAVKGVAEKVLLYLDTSLFVFVRLCARTCLPPPLSGRCKTTPCHQPFPLSLYVGNV